MEKYTILIPTRNRAETLEATIRSCLRQTYKNFEVIVSDNHSTDNTREIVLGLKDPRLKYINPGKNLSMTANFEFALSHVKSGFVMFIGSDDGIMPDAIEYVDSIVKKFNVEAVSCTQATYVWPDFDGKLNAGRLTLGSGKSNVEIRRASKWIKKVLNFESMYCFDLPNLYCGFVSKNVINRAYRDGFYFRSITPDAYSAFATAIFIDRYAFSHRPFVIAGASIKSTGASSMQPSNSDGESQQYLAENDINFYSEFMYCPSFEIICSEAFMQVSRTFPEECRNYKVNYKKMLEAALMNANDKTYDSVSRATSIMGKTLLKNDHDQHKDADFLLPLFNFILRALSGFYTIIFKSPKVVSVENSTLIGVKDVDDAALIGNLLIMQSEIKTITTNKHVIIGRLLNRLKHS